MAQAADTITTMVTGIIMRTDRLLQYRHGKRFTVPPILNPRK